MRTSQVDSDRELAEEYRKLSDENDPSQFRRTSMRKMLKERFHSQSYRELEEQIDKILYGSQKISAETTAEPEEDYIERGPRITGSDNPENSRDIEKVLADPNTDPEKRAFFEMLKELKDKGRKRRTA